MPRVATYDANGVANTFRGPSENVWKGVDVLDYIANPKNGMYFFDDFLLLGGTPAAASVSIGMGGWAAYAEAGAAISADPQQEGGVLEFNSGSASVGITACSQAGWARILSSATNNPEQQDVVFEARVAVGSITTAKRDFFVGLAGNDSIQLNSAANTVIANANNTLAATCSLVGFHFRSTTNPTDVGFCYAATGQSIVYPTNMQTLALTVGGAALIPSVVTAAGSTWVPQTGFIKLGFRYSPYGPKQLITSPTGNQTSATMRGKLLEVFVNGQPCATFLSSDDMQGTQGAKFPSGFMAPVIAYRTSSATSPGGGYIDWIRCAAKGNI